MTLVYVMRDENGAIKGVFAGRQEIAQEAIDDLAEEVQAFLHPKASVSSVSARQFRLQLRRAKLIDQVKAWVAQQDGETQDAFEYSGTFVKDSPMMASGFAIMGFSPQQVDEFFSAATQL
ncbi:hypothetical protein A4U53_011040 [Rhizobium ruizarguesonis]|uniref:Uncharacterized protein n=2 Tax=Rhizobium TaxID=379 RepID=A0A179C0N2_RHILE|nr:hypothetical protein [Rhizobium leguminosarum]OAP96864.1 hypothetical protein A4U53_11800 [Rhizobium leguminosarum]